MLIKSDDKNDCKFVGGGGVGDGAMLMITMQMLCQEQF